MLALLAFALVAQVAADTRPVGAETTIAFAGSGGLREWRRDPEQAGLLHVRDRTERWYQVRLTGDCVSNRPLDTLSYTTDNLNRFDRFPRISFLTRPNVVCGVASVRTSVPPPEFRRRPRR